MEEHPAIRGARGFSLLELMIVLSIAAIVAAIAVPGMRSFLQNQQSLSAATNLMSSLNYARSEAIKEDVQATGGNGITMCASTNGTTCDPAGDWNNGWIVQSTNGANVVTLEVTGPLQAGLALTTAPATPAVTFQPDGTTTLGALVEFTLCDSRGGAYAREVEVDVSGRVQAASQQGFDVTGATALACP